MTPRQKMRWKRTPRERLWQIRVPPVARRYKLRTMRTRRRFPSKGKFDGYLRGQFMFQRRNKHLHFPRFHPALHFDRLSEFDE